jgi:manganese/zinc/iron transport system substrate-binding protein
MSKNTLIAGLALGALMLGGCSTDAGTHADGPSGAEPLLQVVTTTGMIADTARAVAGDRVDVTALMGPGVDPHLYKASESDVRRLGDADLVLYNGLHLEGKMGEILEKMARSRPVVAVAEVVPEDRRRKPDGYEGQYDPHVWFDVGLWALTVDPIVEALSGLDPAHAADYRQRGDALKAQYGELDAWVEARIAELPQEQRVLVTAHDAFGYFGQRYGLEVSGIQGLSTAAEAGLADVDRIVDLVSDRKLRAIFVESSVPQRTIDAVRAGCEAKGHSVDLGGELFSDAMGAPGTPEGTYDGMVRHNTNTIVEALK